MASVLALAIVTGIAVAAGGQLDTSFSNDGKRTTTFGPNTDEGKGVAIQPDGRIVVAGSSQQNGTGTDFAVARYTETGGLDTSFSGDGKQMISFGTGASIDIGAAVAVQPNGKIVVAGDSEQGAAGTNFALARLNANGSLDNSFAGDGRRSINFGNGADTDEAEAVLVQPDGKIVVVGDSDQTNTSGTGIDFAVTRLLSGGDLDTGFSDDGKRLVNFGPATGDSGQSLAIQENGRIVVSGVSDGGFALARLRSNGGLDTTFSVDGRRIVVYGDEGDDVAIQPNGRIVMAGTRGADFAVIRLLPGGPLDTSFSGDGTRSFGFGAGSSDEGDDLAIQANGRILVTGTADVGPPTESDFAIARLRSGGALDTSFSSDGMRTISFNSGLSEVEEDADDVAIQPNGRIVMAGHADKGATGVDFAIARLLAD